MFVILVLFHKAEVLLPFIRKHIAPGSIIYNDCWKVYGEIDEEIYQHNTMNHTNNFIDSNTGYQIQNIEKLWKDYCGIILRYGHKEDHFNHYLIEFVFKKTFDGENRLDVFFKIVATIYPMKM